MKPLMTEQSDDLLELYHKEHPDRMESSRFVEFIHANTEESIMCNQFPEKECYNKDGNRCKTCEYQSLCLCTRIDRPHIEEQPKQESKKCPECGEEMEYPVDDGYPAFCVNCGKVED